MNEAEFTELQRRLQVVEDRLDILNLLAGSPFSSDVPSQAFWRSMYDDQAVMEMGVEREPLTGLESLVDVLSSDHHMSAINAGMAHVAALPHIRIDGDKAVATGYLQVLTPNPMGPEVALGVYPPSRGLFVWRLTANRWELVRTGQGWRVTMRSIRTVPTREALELLHRAIDTND